MSMTVHVDIVSAEAEMFSGSVEMVFAPAVMGEVGIAPRHTQMLTQLKAGDVRLKLPNGEEEVFYVSGGILEVQPHVVTILSDTSLRAHDIDEARAMEAKRRAEEILSENVDDVDYTKAKSELLEALAQLRTIEKIRKRK